MKKLVAAGVDSPRRDCLVLVEDLLDKDRSWVNAHAEYELNDEQISVLDEQLKRRINREPLAYIRGKAWFYKRFFEVNPDVLIPRPESESFIELLKELDVGTVVDVGTGSGCLAITAKLELPQTQVFATDISSEALKVAQKNALNHKTEINFVQGNFLEPINELDLENYAILANLPYVPNDLVTSPEIKTEPELALFSGTDGLDHYRQFWKQVNELHAKPKYILTESLENQHEQLEKLAKESSYRLLKTDVLVQLFEKA
ncbi:peptide chain release factor N(5)-glutamine methyltransferase [Candidatus Saccharibacteria bacterium]|nr:peptide chain release factor N(5)-glutamine methyltransferase [Candidatus Saccharibacteria bacterium]